MSKIALIFMCLMAFIPAASAIASKVPYYGINHDFVWTKDEEIPALIQAMKDANVQAVRIPVRWTMAEPELGKWDFTKIDSVVRQLREAKIEMLGLLMSVPLWASEVKHDLKDGFPDVYAPAHMEDWAEFVRKVSTRYKNEIRYWEIWNEQNGQDFYKPMPDAVKYVEILKSAHGVIKKVDPDDVLVMGGLQMNGIIPNPWSPVKVENFLQKTYDAGGKPYFDVVNIHPYVIATPEEGPDYCAKLVRDAVEVMKRNGDGNKPLWITETGCFTNETITETKQAEHLEGVYRELGKITQVRAIYWFTLRDYGSSICGGEDTMGMMTFEGRRKPAFESYRILAGK